MRIGTTLALIATLFGTTVAAQAQTRPLGSQGQLTLSAERLFGFHWVSTHVDGNNGAGDRDGSATMVGFGWHYAQNPPFNQPRAGIDYFVTNGLSIGGSIGFFSGNITDQSASNVEYDGFLFSPRIGYAIPLSRAVSFWPRGGVTYIAVGDDSVLALSGEAAFVFQPQPSWGILLSPTLDLGPFGNHDGNGNGDDDTEFRAYSIGVTVGIVGIL
jgi:hypothetical protein